MQMHFDTSAVKLYLNHCDKRNLLMSNFVFYHTDATIFYNIIFSDAVFGFLTACLFSRRLSADLLYIGKEIGGYTYNIYIITPKYHMSQYLSYFSGPKTSGAGKINHFLITLLN